MAFQRVNEDLCSGSASRLAGVWDDAVQRGLAGQFEATGLAYAPDTWSRVETLLDGWSEAWEAARRDACEATHVRREQSATLLDARMACLDDRLRALRALTGVLARADVGVVENSVSAAHGLPAVKSCSDPTYVQATIKLSEDVARANRVEVGREQLARARALEEAGKYAEGLEVAGAVHTTALELGYPPLVAEAELRIGRLQSKAGRYEESEAALEEAFFGADELGMSRIAQDAALELTYVVGYRRNRFDDGLRWGRHAQAKVSGRDDPKGRADLENNLGTVYTGGGRFERALGLRRQTLPPGHPALGWTLNNLGAAHWGLGDLDQAERYHREALELRERTLGSAHPDVAASLNNLAAVFNERGDLDRGKAFHERALSIRRKALDPDHVDLAASRNNLGSVLLRMEQYAEAEPHLRQAAVAFERSLGPDHPYVLVTLGNLGQVYIDLGQPRDAIDPLRRVFDHASGKVGENPLDAAAAGVALARAYAEADRPAEAAALARQAEGLLLEHDGEPGALVEARLTLARALWDSGRRPAARALAETARAEGQASQATETPPFAELVAWLTER